MRPAVLLIPVALSCFVAAAQPSDNGAPTEQPHVQRTLERRCPLPTIQSGQAKPLETVVGCETKLDLRLDAPITVSGTLKVPQNAYCAATYAVEYTQKDTKVGVAGVIDNKDCAASSGEYKLLVRVRGETGDVKTLDFLGSWQRDDDAPVKFSGDYPIGNNVDLVNVRVVQVRCTCSDAPAE